MRPSIESARIAEPAYSITVTVPPAVPMRPMMASTMSLGGRLPAADRRRRSRACSWTWHAKRLGREHMLDLRRADAEGERAETRRGSRYGCRRRRWSCRAGSGPARAPRYARCPGGYRPSHNARCRIRPRCVRASRPEARIRVFDTWLRSVVGTLWSATASCRLRSADLAARPCAGLRRPGGSYLVHEVAVDIDDTHVARPGRTRDARPRSCRRGSWAWVGPARGGGFPSGRARGHRRARGCRIPARLSGQAGAHDRPARFPSRSLPVCPGRDCPGGRRSDLVAAARSQGWCDVSYDPAYVAIPYPMGDVDRATGVCTDVIVRAYRDAVRADLQRLIMRTCARNLGISQDLGPDAARSEYSTIAASQPGGVLRAPWR